MYDGMEKNIQCVTNYTEDIFTLYSVTVHDVKRSHVHTVNIIHITGSTIDRKYFQ